MAQPLWNANGTPNIDTVNLAVIPGTTTPVAVNTINQGYPSGSWPASNCSSANPNYVTNSVFYNANSGGTSIINMEGYTRMSSPRRLRSPAVRCIPSRCLSAM